MTSLAVRNTFWLQRGGSDPDGGISKTAPAVKAGAQPETTVAPAPESKPEESNPLFSQNYWQKAFFMA